VDGYIRCSCIIESVESVLRHIKASARRRCVARVRARRAGTPSGRARTRACGAALRTRNVFAPQAASPPRAAAAQSRWRRCALQAVSGRRRSRSCDGLADLSSRVRCARPPHRGRAPLLPRARRCSGCLDLDVRRERILHGARVAHYSAAYGATHHRSHRQRRDDRQRCARRWLTASSARARARSMRSHCAHHAHGRWSHR
jgi:hypothetical protein